MAQRTKTDTVNPTARETSPTEETRDRSPEPANDNERVVFLSWDAALVPE